MSGPVTAGPHSLKSRHRQKSAPTAAQRTHAARDLQHRSVPAYAARDPPISATRPIIRHLGGPTNATVPASTWDWPRRPPVKVEITPSLPCWGFRHTQAGISVGSLSTSFDASTLGSGRRSSPMTTECRMKRLNQHHQCGKDQLTYQTYGVCPEPVLLSDAPAWQNKISIDCKPYLRCATIVSPSPAPTPSRYNRPHRKSQNSANVDSTKFLEPLLC